MKFAFQTAHPLPALACHSHPAWHARLGICTGVTTMRADGPSAMPSRRRFLRIAAACAAAGATGPALARRGPTKPLASALAPLVRVRDSLGDLRADVENGTNGELRRVMSTLLKGNKLNENVREASLWLPPSAAAEVETRGREAYEYLNQVVEYFDTTATKERPQSEILSFSLQAISAAAKQMDAVLAQFPEAEVANAREQLTLPFLP